MIFFDVRSCIFKDQKLILRVRNIILGLDFYFDGLKLHFGPQTPKIMLQTFNIMRQISKIRLLAVKSAFGSDSTSSPPK